MCDLNRRLRMFRPQTQIARWGRLLQVRPTAGSGTLRPAVYDRVSVQPAVTSVTLRTIYTNSGAGTRRIASATLVIDLITPREQR